jgi:hypothetical protein
MAQIQLNNEEAQVLKEYLEHKVTELDVEIHRTDRLEFKNELRHRRDILTRIRDSLAGSTAVPPAL